MTRTVATAGLILTSLAWAACLGRIPSPLKPCPDVPSGGAVVANAAAAVAAVRAHFGSEATRFDFVTPEVEEAEREWVVDVQHQDAVEPNAGPRAVPFRVCKADGSVDSSLRL